MADSTEGVTDVLHLELLIPALIALVAGLVIYSFIIGVNLNDWSKGKLMTPVDYIITSVGISRMCAQCANTLFLFMATLFPKNLELLGAAYDFFTYANFCLTTLLLIVFCLKISNFHGKLFLYLKGIIVRRTVCFIVASVLLSAFISMMLYLMSFSKVTKGETYNATMQNLSMDCTSIEYIYNYTIGASFPLLFYCISSVLLFTSLYHHITNMKMSSNLTVNLETYYSVMKLVSFTFIYNTLYFIGHFIGVFYYFFYCVDIAWLRIVMDFLPVLHSSYLIYKTAKLRNQMAKVFQNIIDFFFQRESERP